MHIITPTGINFNKGWVELKGRRGVVFKVKGCSDAFINLQGIPGVSKSDSYEVLLGSAGNRKSAIRPVDIGSKPKVVADTPGILNCTAFRTFWIRWDGGKIQVGRGSIYGINRFLSWSEPSPMSINAVSFIALEPAEWRTDLPSGKCTGLHLHHNIQKSCLGNYLNKGQMCFIRLCGYQICVTLLNQSIFKR